MSNENISHEGLSDDEVLSYTQKVRLDLVEEMKSNGFPEKARDREVFLSALADMDRAAHTNKKIGVSQQQAGADALVAQALGKIANHYGSSNPFEGNSDNPVIPHIDTSRLPKSESVPGETDIGISTQKFSDFVNKFED